MHPGGARPSLAQQYLVPFPISSQSDHRAISGRGCGTLLATLCLDDARPRPPRGGGAWPARRRRPRRLLSPSRWPPSRPARPRSAPAAAEAPSSGQTRPSTRQLGESAAVTRSGPPRRVNPPAPTAGAGPERPGQAWSARHAGVLSALYSVWSPGEATASPRLGPPSSRRGWPAPAASCWPAPTRPGHLPPTAALPNAVSGRASRQGAARSPGGPGGVYAGRRARRGQGVRGPRRPPGRSVLSGRPARRPGRC